MLSIESCDPVGADVPLEESPPLADTKEEAPADVALSKQ